MSDMMTFPDTVEEFMEQYKIVDDEKVYTNGADLVPIFRMMQWFEHVSAKDTISRQAAIDALKTDMASLDHIIKGMSGYDVRLDAYVSQRNQVNCDIDTINNLPPVQPELGTNLAEVGTDCISRQAAIDAIDEQIAQCNKALKSLELSMKDEYAVKVEKASLTAFRERLEYLPPAQPQRTGKCMWCEDDGRRCGIVYEEDIAKINDWFDSHTEYYGTYHSDECYSVDESDMESFKDLLRQEFPDLIGIRCFVGTGDSAIWFFEEDLKDARFY